MSSATQPHIPVLLDEVVDALAIVPGERHVDATFGAGGYTEAILERGAEVAAFDRDPTAIESGQTLLAAVGGRLTLIQAHDREIGDDILSGARMGWPAILSSLKSLLETETPLVIKLQPPQKMLAALKAAGVKVPEM